MNNVGSWNYYFFHSKGKRKVIKASILVGHSCVKCFLMSPCLPSRREKVSVCSFLCSPLTREARKCVKSFFLSWQSLLQLIFHYQADEDKHSLRMEAETTEPCSHRAIWAPPLPGGLNPNSTALIQFVHRLSDVKGFEDPPFNLMWCFGSAWQRVWCVLNR